MDFTFGIITANINKNIDTIINSIYKQNIPNYEIIIIGNGDLNILNNKNNIRIIQYSDKSSSGDISIKKNIITNNALYENIVYLHDYIILEDNWYVGFLKYGNIFNICMTKILNLDNSRYRDWTLWSDDANNYVANFNYLIPYDMIHLSKMMYISGAYWVAKKDFMLNNMLNEKLTWGQGEDVEWSIRARAVTDFKMNIHSSVKLLKQKYRIFNLTTDEENSKLNYIKEYNDRYAYEKLINNHIGNFLK